LQTRSKRIELAPEAFVADIPRLEASLRAFEASRLEVSRDRPLLLIGRRHLRSNNSWMHNSQRLVKGRNRCTLLMHPDDAQAIAVRSGDRVRITSRVGSVEAEAEVTDTILQGVVSLPHGWGHDREGTQLRVASEHAGVSLNDLTDDALIDRLSGATHLNGIPVKVERPAASKEAAATTAS
jgi:anaerobic selenocysteine-containing dehydrogenase